VLGALSIDLDALVHYHRLHGLADPPTADDPVYGRAVERFGELCARLGARGTAFCVGRDLERPGAAAAVAALARAGHELANHTLSHDYALALRPAAEIAREVRGGADAVARAGGARPVGFRAPGYALSAPLVAALVADGYRYDSSAFPALPYYAAKAAVMAALAVARRPSAAVLDRPRALLAPRAPYRPREDEPYARGGAALVELPVTTGLLGFPLIGTFVTTLPPWLLRAARAGAGRLPLFNLELHGIDLLDASDAAPELAARRPDLRVPAAAKLARIERFARELGREWVTLADAAERLAPAPC
jgi:peptidoglycan-N-acetylglucosamine deacetylase